MERGHMHRPQAAKATVKDWVRCVTPEYCAAHPKGADAHGNIITIDTCACGATRASESNGGVTNYGEWKMPKR